MKHRNHQEERSNTHQTGKNAGSNSGLPQEAEGELDYLPMGHPSNHLFWDNPYLSGSGSGMEALCCVRVYENAS
jgi:hypothetical protein